MRAIRYFSSYDDDFEKSAKQNYTLPENYQWVKNDIPSKILSGLVYGLAVIFGGAYCKCVLHMKVKGRHKLKGLKGDCFIYGNHTQPIGDVFIPALCVLPKRIYTVVSPANYGIPLIGKILPYLGALPVGSSLHDIKELNKAIEEKIKEKHPIVIYPEAHVWKYYTGIRPFSQTSFKYPAKLDKPAIAMTVTYRKSKVFKRPLTEVYLDGPYYAAGNTGREKTENLRNRVYDAMKRRSENSNYEYIEYRKKENII